MNFICKAYRNKTPDHKVYPQLIKDAPKTVKRTYGDGAYDLKGCYPIIFTDCPS